MRRSSVKSLEQLSAAVADGAAVDWSRENLSDSRIENLIAIGRVSEVLRGEGDPDVIAVGGGEATVMDCGNPSLPCQWGHLEIRERIDSGSYGVVYEAYDTRLEKVVALKILRAPTAGEADWFLKEARKLARVDHENVVRVYGADRHRSCFGFWMERIEGRTLESILKADGPFSHREAQRIGLDLARGIAACHAQGLLHRDIKTSNVMREKGGRIVLMDFSSAVEQLENRGRETGTPLYMAPELFAGGTSSPQTDVYSLGVLLYRLVSGRYPVDGRSRGELEGKHRRGSHVPLMDVRPDLPGWFIQVVERAIHHDPVHRFGSIGEMAQALRENDGADSGTEARRAPAPGGMSWWKRWQVLAPAAAALAVAGFFLARTLMAPAFTVDSGLYRVGTDSDERLREGATVTPGDQLFLEIESNAPVYAYVVNEDENGNAYLLFPLPELDLGNPLPADATLRLPGPLAGEEVYWDVTSAGGTETILVVAAKDPQEDLENLLASLGGTVRGGPIPLDSDTGVRLRGVGGLSRHDKDTKVTTITGNVMVTAARNSDVWMWEMKLLNP